jgi:hypothetical protein
MPSSTSTRTGSCDDQRPGPGELNAEPSFLENNDLDEDETTGDDLAEAVDDRALLR